MSSKMKEGKKTVTIRGLDSNLYKRLLVMAEETGRTVGELMNEAMKLLLSIGSTAVSTGKRVTSGAIEVGKSFAEGVKEGYENALVISDINELVVSKRDLESVEEHISFRNIGTLVFDDDVPYELFEKKVASIAMCDKVIIPSNFPKLKVLTKCKLVKSVEVRK
ncbi:MAG TPA: hypothetical protein ENF75_03800 [Acidilobales archaeon]|nr:hypothetical protein [Acidilobales archaeon]